LSATDVDFLATLITNQPWWDITDNLDRTVGIIATKQQMLDWAQRSNFWLRRVAIIHQLKRKSATDTDLLAQIIILNLGSQEFFINKAIGWALREYSKTDPGWVNAFITTHRDHMATLTVREASKYL
jgi:DNA alkylation repair enzyme